MRKDLCIVLTARMNSERLPGKAMAEVRGQPLIYWIVRRLATIGTVVLATTQAASDGPLASFVRAMDMPVYTGSTEDVITRMDQAVQKYAPEARFVLRGLGDCPFMAGELIERACSVMARTHSDVFAWALPPWSWPVYGSREFPYSRAAWERVVSLSTQREHVDMFYLQNRDKFTTTWHDPPSAKYFRNYRLEIDWPEDLAMVRALAEKTTLTASTPDIIATLDRNPKIPALNRQRVELTGPSCYTYAEQRAWYTSMKGQPIWAWDNHIWKPPSATAEPIFCDNSTCLLGYAEGGTLWRLGGDQIKGDARLQCECGTGRRWQGKV